MNEVIDQYIQEVISTRESDILTFEDIKEVYREVARKMFADPIVPRSKYYRDAFNLVEPGDNPEFLTFLVTLTSDLVKNHVKRRSVLNTFDIPSTGR